MSTSRMRRTLVVTNDFPPTVGGIQSYVRDFLDTQDPATITVFASTQDAEAARAHDATLDYEVIRWPRSVMLPTPTTAYAMAEIIQAREIDNVWFGAAAPLALLGSRAREAGASRIIASTHGHEVGWSMLPVARQMLRRIGEQADIVTYISDYTLNRFRSAFGPSPTFRHLPSGVDAEVFHPATPEKRVQTRAHWQLEPGTPVISCISRLVPRKGQDKLIAALPAVLETHPEATLVIVGAGRIEAKLRQQAAPLGDAVRFLGSLTHQDMVDVLAASDVFAMPARTRGGGLDVEGLGIVYLEAQACGIPVIAGNSGGAPETVTPRTGLVVDGRDVDKLSAALTGLLSDHRRRTAMGIAGRAQVENQWLWDFMGARLTEILNAESVRPAQ